MVMSNRKKILHLMPCYGTGGAEMLVLNYAKKLNKNKYNIYIANTVEDGELRGRLEKEVSGIFVGSRQTDGGRFGVWKNLKKYINKLKPDLIHSHLLGADFFASKIKKKADWSVRWVSTQHNVEYNTSVIRRILWKHLLQKADKVITVSKEVYNYSNQQFKIPEHRLNLLLNGVDLSPWLAVSSKNNDNKIHLATIGRLEKQKGHQYLLLALSKLKKLSWQWHVYGDGSLKSSLRAQACKLGINNKIIWHGVTENISEQLNKIDLIVQPSLWEGLSLVVMETMAAGRCVLTTYPAGQELIKHKHNGYLTKAADVSGLEKALRDLLINKNDRLEIGKQARIHAEQNFGMDKHIVGLEKIYDKLLIS